MANQQNASNGWSNRKPLSRWGSSHSNSWSEDSTPRHNVTIPEAEYNDLLRCAKEFKLLKNTFIKAGVTHETLDTLIRELAQRDNSRDSCASALPNHRAEDLSEARNGQPKSYAQVTSLRERNPWTTRGEKLPSESMRRQHPSQLFDQQSIKHSNSGSRPYLNTTYGTNSPILDSSSKNGDGCGRSSDFNDVTGNSKGRESNAAKRSIYFSGFPEKTTLRDLVAVIKGGELVHIQRHTPSAATVAFWSGAENFLAWAKRNDIYLHGKRVQVRWALRQYEIHHHLMSKILSGVTRNIVIYDAVEKGITESQIVNEMDHIENLAIIDVTFHGGNAHISTNSIQKAFFAKTCMMSREPYRQCRVRHAPDECGQPLPASQDLSWRAKRAEPAVKTPFSVNRFNVLDVDDLDDTTQSEDEDEEVFRSGRRRLDRP